MVEEIPAVEVLTSWQTGSREGEGRRRGAYWKRQNVALRTNSLIAKYLQAPLLPAFPPRNNAFLLEVHHRVDPQINSKSSESNCLETPGHTQRSSLPIFWMLIHHNFTPTKMKTAVSFLPASDRLC